MSKRVVVLGASADRAKFSNKALRGFVQRGETVIPINPKGGAIEGLPVTADLSEVTGPVDILTVYLPAPVTLKLVDKIAALKPAQLFLNPGAESPELVAALEAKKLNVIQACTLVTFGLE
ncbi:MAG: CoA-binding protein [Planctomycetota bacterium]